MRSFMGMMVAIALMFAASLALAPTVSATESDGENGATLSVDQGTCPDYALAVSVTGDDDSPTDVRINGDKQDIGHGGSPTLEPGEDYVFDVPGTYELDIVDGGETPEVLVFVVEDEFEAAACPSPGSITIVKDTNPESEDIEFDFDGDFGDFDLEDDESITFNNLVAGNYYVQENEADGYSLADINCSASAGSHVNIDDSDREVFITLSEGGSVTCTFINEPTPVQATPVPPTATPTVFDQCDNIEGIQTTIPAGMKIRVSGGLILCEVPTPTPAPPVVISPPNTGDAGLAATSAPASRSLIFGGGIVAVFMVGASLLARKLVA